LSVRGAPFERLLTFHSLSKRSGLPGLRSGIVAGDASLMERFRHPSLCAAAYNAGAGAVQEWVDAAHADGHDLRIRDIPFEETRAYVRSVLEARAAYRQTYGDELQRRP